MANLIEIDLDRNLVTPIPEGVDKTSLALLVANHFGYKETTDKVERLDFSGLKTDFEASVVDREVGVDLWIIEAVEDGENVTVTYDVKNSVPSAMTAYEFGIFQYTKVGGDLIRNIVREIETKKMADQIKALEDQAAADATAAAAIFDNVVAR